MDYAVQAENIIRGAKIDKQRTGQWLFNHLPDEAANKVRGTLFDPFHKDLSHQELLEWIDQHLIWNNHGEIIGLFDQNTILWEKAA